MKSMRAVRVLCWPPIRSERAIARVCARQDQASWSSRGRRQLVADSDHYIQFDRADVVIDAVKEVVADVREQSSE